MKNFLKNLTIALSIIVIIPLQALAFYDDVPTDHPNYASIKILHDLGQLPDYEDNLFKPDEKLSQLELIKFILAYAKVDLATEIALPYTNTDNEAQYSTYLQTALNLGIIPQPGNNKEFNFNLKPGKRYTLTLMFKTLGIGTNFFNTESTFKDVKPQSATNRIAEEAAKLGIIDPEKPDYFRGGTTITRAQGADFLYKIFQQNPGNTIVVQIGTSNSNSNYTKPQQNLINSEEFNILLNVWDNLQTNYINKDNLNDKDLVFSAIKGLVDKVGDKYTIFEEPDEAGNLLNTLSNEYEGVGMSVEMIDNSVTIISPFKGSPAEKGGLKPNDIIIEVDDEDITGQTLTEVVTKIKGPAGTSVKLKVKRDGKFQTFTITRESITYSNVQSEMISSSGQKIGYISIISFGDQTYNDFVEAANTLLEENPSGFIIDLRNNPGGYLDSAINMLGLFSKEEFTAVQLQYSDDTKEIYKTDSNGLLADQKIVILMNEGSASASEIMAGSLQDQKLATLIGTQSFGKGTVQQLETYTNGSLFKFTISKWLTSEGRDINEKGLTPDIKIEDNATTAADEQLEKAKDQF